MNISKMNDADLLQLFKNANRMLLKGPNVQAESAIAAIECEWKKRLDLARAGIYKSQQPQVGMLATLGYHVGNTIGERTPIRRLILKNLLERQLPMVESPAYTDEWGTPKSPKRYWKLVRFLESQINNPRNDNAPNMEKAMIEWSEDLEWLQKTFSHLVTSVTDRVDPINVAAMLANRQHLTT